MDHTYFISAIWQTDENFWSYDFTFFSFASIFISSNFWFLLSLVQKNHNMKTLSNVMKNMFLVSTKVSGKIKFLIRYFKFTYSCPGVTFKNKINILKFLRFIAVSVVISFPSRLRCRRPRVWWWTQASVQINSTYCSGNKMSKLN